MPPVSNPAITWQAIQAAATQLGRISTANGFRTNAGNNVLVEQVQADPARGPVERLSVYLDRASRSPATLGGHGDWTLQIVVEADVRSIRADAQHRAHAVMADVFAVFPPGGIELSIAAGVVEIEAQNAEFLTRIDGSNASVGQIRLQAIVRQLF